MRLISARRLISNYINLMVYMQALKSKHRLEVVAGERFSFGENWARFLSVINENRIKTAEQSILDMLEVDSLYGKRFLDIGSGSGLFSLAARRLGAKVHSFDYDSQAVACTAELKRRYFPNDPDWSMEEGSVLDQEYIKSLGRWDVVYSWGVLHHTGAMWRALENVAIAVEPNGKLFIALYNDQGRASKRWLRVKKIYNLFPWKLKSLVLVPCLIRLWGPTLLRDSLKGHPLSTWTTYTKNRGMSPWVDVIDWVGGYPFEVSKPEDIFYFYKSKGFTLSKLKTCAGGIGCNEYVFNNAVTQ